MLADYLFCNSPPDSDSVNFLPSHGFTASIGPLVRFHKFPVHIASVNKIAPLDFASDVDPVILGFVSLQLFIMAL